MSEKDGMCMDGSLRVNKDEVICYSFRSFFCVVFLGFMSIFIFIAVVP